jgi:hypothetical protein
MAARLVTVRRFHRRRLPRIDRDELLVFNEMGIPATTCGPPRSFRKQATTIDDLASAAMVHARVAIEVCGRGKPLRSPRSIAQDSFAWASDTVAATGSPARPPARVPAAQEETS